MEIRDFRSVLLGLTLTVSFWYNMGFGWAQTPTAPYALNSQVPELTQEEDTEAHKWAQVMKQFVHETDRPIHVYNWAPKSILENATGKAYSNNMQTLKNYITEAERWFWKIPPDGSAAVGSGLYLAVDPWISANYGGKNISDRVLTDLEIKAGTKYFSYNDAKSRPYKFWDSYDRDFYLCVSASRNCGKHKTMDRALEILGVDLVDYAWGTIFAPKNYFYITLMDSSLKNKIFARAFVLANSKAVNWDNSRLTDTQSQPSNPTDLLLRLSHYVGGLEDPLYNKDDFSTQNNRMDPILDKEQGKNILKEHLKKYLFWPYNRTEQEKLDMIEERFK